MATGTTTDVHPRENCIAPDIAFWGATVRGTTARLRAYSVRQQSPPGASCPLPLERTARRRLARKVRRPRGVRVSLGHDWIRVRAARARGGHERNVDEAA